MTLDLAAVPLAWLAGIVGIASPCVWPLVPVVMSAAVNGGRTGSWFLGLGLSTAFAVAGTGVVWLLLNLGLDPELLRYAAAATLVFVALTILVKALGDRVMRSLSRLVGRSAAGHARDARSPAGQFALGALLGFVWLPCVGPTLGAAITLASLGQDMPMAAAIMFSFGAGTAMALLLAGTISGSVLARWKPGVIAQAGSSRRGALLVLGVMVLTGVDRMLGAWSLRWLPDWAVGV